MSKKRLISPPVGTTLRQARGEKSLVEGGRESMDEEREGCISPEGRCTARNDSLLLWATDRRIEPPSPINSARGGRKGWIFFFFFFFRKKAARANELSTVFSPCFLFSLSLFFFLKPFCYACMPYACTMRSSSSSLFLLARHWEISSPRFPVHRFGDTWTIVIINF